MMGIQEPDNSKIFYTNINIAERIRRDHPLRRIAAKVDFDFTYKEEGTQRPRGAHRGVRPTLLTKCVFLRVFEENSGGNGV